MVSIPESDKESSNSNYSDNFCLISPQIQFSDEADVIPDSSDEEYEEVDKSTSESKCENENNKNDYSDNFHQEQSHETQDRCKPKGSK